MEQALVSSGAPPTVAKRSRPDGHSHAERQRAERSDRLFTDAYAASYTSYWEGNDMPLTPEDMAHRLGAACVEVGSRLLVPGYDGGPEDVAEDLGHLAGLCAAIADQWDWDSFRSLNALHFRRMRRMSRWQRLRSLLP